MSGLIQVLLGHAKLDTRRSYPRRRQHDPAVMSPLDRLTPF
jgi:hypothetical protein